MRHFRAKSQHLDTLSLLFFEVFSQFLVSLWLPRVRTWPPTSSSAMNQRPKKKKESSERQVTEALFP